MSRTPALPTLPERPIPDAVASRAMLRTLRQFHLGNPQARAALPSPGADLLPALLAPYRDASRLRYDYPLMLLPPDPEVAAAVPEQMALPVAQWLRETLAALAPGDEAARILKDNLGWLERALRQRLRDEEAPRPAGELLAGAASGLVDHLDLDDASRGRLERDLDGLCERVPDGARLLGYGKYPALHLLVHAIRCRVVTRHAAFAKEVEHQLRVLRTLLEVEAAKSQAARAPERLQASIGPAGLVDPAALSGLMDHSQGSVRMPPARRTRIETAIATLEAFRDDPVLVRFIHHGAMSGGWLDDQPGFEALSDPDPCARATALFDESAGRLARVFAAVRIARLEADDAYDPAVHDPWFERFGWEAFSSDELLLVPAIVALEGAHRVAGEVLASFSRLLHSGRPVQVLVRVQAHNNPGARTDEEPFQNYRTELGYLGIAHRQAFVHQTSAARHRHLLTGYIEALDATRTSLHLINTGLKTAGNEAELNAWLVAGAALEGRVHPFFRLNPGRGDSAVESFALDDNPDPECDWPSHPFRYRDRDGSEVELRLAFTFADYGLILPRLRDHYALVPPGCDGDELVPIEAYLTAHGEQSTETLPFVWGVDGEGTLHRLVATRTLIHACRDRLNFWRRLQEIGGVRNRHVDAAVAAARRAEQAAAEARVAALEAAHADALARARAEAAGEVMARLTDVLMGLDLSVPAAPRAAAVAPPTPAPETSAQAAEPEVSPAVAPEQPAVLADAPWIDTPLCTSCNDCLAVNPLLFVYNEDNQAVLGDLAAGSYAQLIEAAEICPSRCIHPGAPRDPSEPGLDALRERAAAFD